MSRAKKGTTNENVRPQLHQNALGIIIMALDNAISVEPEGSRVIPAFARVRRKLGLNRNSIRFSLKDHRHLVPWIKHQWSCLLKEKL